MIWIFKNYFYFLFFSILKIISKPPTASMLVGSKHFSGLSVLPALGGSGQLKVLTAQPQLCKAEHELLELTVLFAVV